MIFMKTFALLLLAFLTLCAQSVEIEILGSGGPEIDGRASTSYLLWIDGKARALIDAGSGAMLRFEQSGAELETLEAVLLTHLHIDHAVDLPAFVKAGYFTRRTAPLPVVGPAGNAHFPGTKEYLTLLFGDNGAYRYMSDVLTQESDSFQIVPKEIQPEKLHHLDFETFSVDAVAVPHGIVPALAYRITVGDKVAVISGDTSDSSGVLASFAEGADLFIAHHAVPETAGRYAKQLHMSPSAIGRIARLAGVKRVVLTHRMNRTKPYESQSVRIIRSVYKGEFVFAEDRMRIKL
jgi:ribonuclease BN (tRNA processing enzyme)